MEQNSSHSAGPGATTVLLGFTEARSSPEAQRMKHSQQSLPLSLSLRSQVFLGNPASCYRVPVMSPGCVCVHQRFNSNTSSTGTLRFGKWYKASLSSFQHQVQSTHKALSGCSLGSVLPPSSTNQVNERFG